MLKRATDILVSLIGLGVLFPVLLLIALAVRLDSPGPIIFWSQRFGREGRLFAMPKFRTMKVGTPQVPTHLMNDGRSYLTRLGGFLRASSLDELPQLYSVLRGDMSLVGPRPALFNQHDLMKMRKGLGVDRLRPGITGWAQINGRDNMGLEEKVRYEAEYLAKLGVIEDAKILALTVQRVLLRQDVAH